MTLPYKWDGQENAIDRARRAWRGLLGSAFPGVGQIARGDFTGLLSDLGAKAREGLARKPFDASEDAAVRDMNRAMDFISPAGLLGGMTKFEKAHKIAQKNAALPVEKGGLGLPKNNTAADRAKAMGFEDGWAHGSPSPDVKKMLPSKTGAEGPGAYATNHLPEASTYAMGDSATVYPLMVNRGKAFNAKSNPYDALGADDDLALLNALKQRGFDSISAAQPETSRWLVEKGAQWFPQREHFVSMFPENFRSRFAAFDPKRKHEADLLAGYFGFVPSQE